MKIAFINHDFIIGDGTGTVFWNLARRLAKDHEVTIFTFNSNYDGHYGVQIVEIPVPFKGNKFVNPGLIPFLSNKWIELRRLLQSYQVIYTHLYPANLIPLLPTKIKGPLQIYTEWTTQRAPGFPLYTKIFGSFIDRIDSYVVKHVDRVIAPSLHAERWLKEKFGIKSSLLHLDGIDFATLDKNTVSTEEYPCRNVGWAADSEERVIVNMLVTGGSGALGRCVIGELLKASRQLVVALAERGGTFLELKVPSNAEDLRGMGNLGEDVWLGGSRRKEERHAHS